MCGNVKAAHADLNSIATNPVASCAPRFRMWGRSGMRFSESDNRDRLTGAATEAALTGFAAAALENAAPHGPPVCFLQIDVDGLAGIHEEHGALVCDAVLLGVADCLREGIRGHDLLGRSADGFGLCMTELTAAQARAVAQRLRLRILSNPVATAAGALDVTCSIGFALSADAESGAEWLIGRAREARHAAQCEGGDRVVAAVCYGGLARHARR